MVSPGVGMAPRQYHIPGIDRFRCFESEHPDVVKHSLGGLAAHAAHFGAELIKSGYDNNSRTLFNWEFAFAKPTRNPHNPILILVARTTRGSELALSYAWNAFLSGQGLENKVLTGVTRVMTKKFSMATHGLDPIPSQTTSRNPGWPCATNSAPKVQAALPDSREDGVRRNRN